MEGFCVKCKAKRTIKNPTNVTTSRGRPMIKGQCPQCGTKMGRFLPKS